MNRLDYDEVRTHMNADAGTLYDLVSDVTRTPEWSPEVISCAWLDGAVTAAPGARFTARNRRRWLTWSNKPVVEVADRDSEFAVTRTERGGGSLRWSYRFEPADAGTSVVLAYQVLRPVPAGLHVILRLLFGVRDLRADLHANMVTSLRRLAEVASRETAGSRLPRGGQNPGEHVVMGGGRLGMPAPPFVGQHDEDAPAIHVAGASLHEAVPGEAVDQTGQRALAQVHGIGQIPDYAGVMLPTMLLVGMAFGLGFSSLTVAATAGVRPTRSRASRRACSRRRSRLAARSCWPW